MASPSVAKRAKIVDVLVYYDGPQVVYLKSDRSNDMLAVAVNALDSDSAFFSCEVREKPLNLYMSGRADLRYAFTTALRNHYYLFDLSEERNSEVELLPATKEQVQDEGLWPKVGFFSRSHTSIFGANRAEGTGEQSFVIDGKWGASDFSYFYGKVADLYAMYAIFGEQWNRLNDAAKGGVHEIIRDKLWRGGGSYVGFYDQLLAEVDNIALPTLDVAEISYASPGTLVFTGDANVLSSVGDVIQILDEKKDTLDEEYRKIRGILSNEKLLREKPTTRFSSIAVRNLVKEKTDSFAKMMGIDYTDILYSACGRNVLVYSKLVLSFYRRASEVHLYHAEGRVQPKK